MPNRLLYSAEYVSRSCSIVAVMAFAGCENSSIHVVAATKYFVPLTRVMIHIFRFHFIILDRAIDNNRRYLALLKPSH